jgi:hypothetical protein
LTTDPHLNSAGTGAEPRIAVMPGNAIAENGFRVRH